MPLINKNGIYEAWSSLFNYRDNESFELSKQLPFPNSDLKYTITSEINPEIPYIDITPEILSILNGEYDGDNTRLKLAVDVLNKVDRFKQTNIQLYYNPDLVNDLNYIKENPDDTSRNEDIESARILISNMIENLDIDISRHLKEISPNKLLSATKNFVYNKIYQISDNFKNLVAAESPISMGDPQAAAAKSEAGAYAKTVTDFCPSVKWNLFFENMAGKEVIGISAVGQKVFLAATQYFNQEIRKLAEKGLTVEDLLKSNLYFNNVFEIYKNIPGNKGKSDGELVKLFTNSLANINLDDIEFVYDLLNGARDKSISVNDAIDLTQNRFQEDKSLVISSLISAATDNAKELILSKINAGPDLAGVYVYLLIQGLSFDNISDLMTSSEVNAIVQAATVNRMYDQYATIDSTLRNIEKGPSLTNFIGKGYVKSVSLYLNTLYNSKIISAFKLNELTSNDINEIINDLETTKYNFVNERFLDEEYALTFLDSMSEWDELALVRSSEEVVQGLIRYFKQVRKFKDLKDLFNSSVKSKTNFTTFVKAYTGAKEIATLGQILGINGGIKTKQYDRYNFSKSFNTLIQNGLDKLQLTGDTTDYFIGALKEYNPNIGNIYTDQELSSIVGDALDKMSSNGTFSSMKFDLTKFLEQPDYAESVIKFYNLIKSVINVFDLIDSLPHYKAFINAYYINEQNSKLGSVKYALSNSIIDNLENVIMRRRIGKITMPNKLSESQLNIIRDYIDELIIRKYLKNKNLSISVPKGQNYFLNGEMLTATEQTSYSLSNDDGLASFKLYMESYVIPMLKSGYTINSKGVMTFGSQLVNNAFLNGLIITDNTSKLDGSNYIYYRPSINMVTTINNPEFDKQVSAFGEIENVEFRGIKLSDLFFIYNLITHKGRKGQDSILKVLQGSVFNPGSLIVDYFKYIGGLDLNTITPGVVYDSKSDKVTMDDVNIDDILLRMAPIKDSFEALVSNNKYVKIYNENLGKYQLQERLGNNNKNKSYKDVELLGDERYYLIRSNYNYKLKETINKFEKAIKTVELLNDLMRLNKIKLIINC